MWSVTEMKWRNMRKETGGDETKGHNHPFSFQNCLILGYVTAHVNCLHTAWKLSPASGDGSSASSHEPAIRKVSELRDG